MNTVPTDTATSARQVIAAALCDSSICNKAMHRTHPARVPHRCGSWDHAAYVLAALDRAGYRLLPPGEPDDGVPRGGKAFSASTPMVSEQTREAGE